MVLVTLDEKVPDSQGIWSEMSGNDWFWVKSDILMPDLVGIWVKMSENEWFCDNLGVILPARSENFLKWVILDKIGVLISRGLRKQA